MGFALPTYNPIRTVVNFLRESQEKAENSNIEHRPTKKNHSELNTSVTCFKNGLSHLTFPVSFFPGLSPIKIGPLTSNTVNGSISVIPDDDNLKVFSITSENNLMIKGMCNRFP